MIRTKTASHSTIKSRNGSLFLLYDERLITAVIVTTGERSVIHEVLEETGVTYKREIDRNFEGLSWSCT